MEHRISCIRSLDACMALVVHDAGGDSDDEDESDDLSSDDGDGRRGAMTERSGWTVRTGEPGWIIVLGLALAAPALPQALPQAVPSP
jgi:hypothetical protein